MPAGSVDHVIPRSVLRAVKDLGPSWGNRILTVYSCLECNNLLGATIQGNLEDRKRYLKSRLKERYRKILRIPYWTNKQLEELSPHLAADIIASMHLRRRIEARIAW